MERRKVMIDLQQIDLLEQKIVKVTELVRSLRRERDALQLKLKETQEVLARAQAEAAGSEKHRRELQEMSEQIEALNDERQTIRGKVTRMLEMMSVREETPAEARREH